MLVTVVRRAPLPGVPRRIAAPRLASMSETAPDCIFCKIVAGDVPADVLGRNDRTPSRSRTSTRRLRSTHW